MTNDELLTRLLDAVHTAATDSAKPGHAEIAARLEAQLRAQLAQAQDVIARGVELMPLGQLSQWEGVRAWQESAGDVEAASAAKG